MTGKRVTDIEEKLHVDVGRDLEVDGRKTGAWEHRVHPGGLGERAGGQGGQRGRPPVSDVTLGQLGGGEGSILAPTPLAACDMDVDLLKLRP